MSERNRHPFVNSPSIVATVAIVVVLAQAASQSPATEPEGLVGHWSFNDGTGRDSSGNEQLAGLGGAKIFSLGDGQACLQFAEEVDPLRIPVSPESPAAIERGTVSFWMSTSSDRTSIIRFNNRAVELNSYRGDFQARFRGNDDFRYGTLVMDYDWPKYDMREFAFYGHPRAAVGDAEWHHFAVAYDDQVGKIIGWRDGQLIAVVDLSTVGPEPLMRQGLSEITAGEEFIGFLDDLRIYNRVLSDSELRSVYSSTRSVYADRRDTNHPDRPMKSYRFQEQDRTLYRAWLQYHPPAREQGRELLKTIVAEGRHSTVRTAASELKDAVRSMFSFTPSVTEQADSGTKVVLGTPATSSWIRSHADQLGLDRIADDGFVIRTVSSGESSTLVVAARIPAGVIFGTFDLIRRIQTGQDPRQLDVFENPAIPIRMVDHWSYFRGVFGDRWRGGGRDNSIFSWEELRTGDTRQIRDWVRMMASAGWNAICPCEVNWHYRDNFLDHLDEVEVLAEILRDYGMKLYWSPSYLLALDQSTADALYARVPDFGGYMMKLGSEKQNGHPGPPMVNRIADTVMPWGGTVLVRGFVYGNLRYTPEPYRTLIPHDIFAPKDGEYRENVIIVPKGSAGDWDYSAPIPAIDGALQKNLSGSEQVIDKKFPSSWVEKWKWWLEQDHYHDGPGSLNKLNVDCIMGVSMISPSPSWTSTPLNMVNYYGLGRLAWNPDRTVDEIYTEWIQQTFGHDPEVVDIIRDILLISDDAARKLYMYRGYRGIWIDKGDVGLVERKLPYVINRHGIGPTSSRLQQRVLSQYSAGLRDVFADPLRSEEYLSAFHFKRHDYRLSIGRTLIEDVYGGMEEAVDLAAKMVRLWSGLENRIDDRRYEYTREALVEFAEDARITRDATAAAFEKYTGRDRKETLAGLTADGLARVQVWNVRHFGAGEHAATNDAPAFNAAIDACSSAGGGTVFVPTGIYPVGTIHLKSNITLVLDKGAILRAADGHMDSREPNPHAHGLTDPAFYHWEASLIRGSNLDNIKIYGPGTLDGSSLTVGSDVPEGTGDKGIALRNCRDVEIRNLNIRKGGYCALLATGCRNLLIDNVTIKTDQNGITLAQCRDVDVAHCHIDAVRYDDGYPAGGEDAIKLCSNLSLGTVRPTENVTVRDCSLAAGGSAIHVGSETVGPISHIEFDNIRVHRAGHAGISVTANDGSDINGLRFRGIRMENTFAAVFIRVTDAARVPPGTYRRGSVRNVSFADMTATGCSRAGSCREMPCIIWGKPNSPLEGIRFDRVSISSEGGNRLFGADGDPQENDIHDPQQLNSVPACVLYLRHVKDVAFANCRFYLRKPDKRPAIVVDNVQKITLKSTELPFDTESSARIAVRGRMTNLEIMNCSGFRDMQLTTGHRSF
ncbi:MAG: right-handed parallel beta-helix repeat-containing protein [Fuerstiella sp.]|nr:right-handed parallel beta-helix repeat-containing protein [Fuerstiella sp.]